MRRWIPFLFLASTVISFGLAYFLYESYKDFLSLFAYYGVPETDYSPAVKEVILKYRIGLVSSLVSGIFSLAFLAMFLMKAFKKNE